MALMSSLPPFATRDALRAAVTPSLESLQALSTEREAMVSRADAIDFDAAQWEDTYASYAERVESFTLVAQLRNSMNAQRALQSNALARIAVSHYVENFRCLLTVFVGRNHRCERGYKLLAELPRRYVGAL